jgi:hypothetical protein
MYKCRRELAQDQLDLMNHIRHYANVNIVTCGHCGTILLHSTFADEITCYSNECKDRGEMDLSDCPDLWYEGCIDNMEFDDEEKETYLGNLEQGITNIKVYYIDYGYRLKFYSNSNEMWIADCLDSDHVWRELRARGNKKYVCKAILSML